MELTYWLMIRGNRVIFCKDLFLDAKPTPKKDRQIKSFLEGFAGEPLVVLGNFITEKGGWEAHYELASYINDRAFIVKGPKDIDPMTKFWSKHFWYNGVKYTNKTRIRNNSDSQFCILRIEEGKEPVTIKHRLYKEEN